MSKKMENGKRNPIAGRSGFTLVELLIVLGMMGIFIGSVFTLYQTHQKSAYVGEEVVEVQQNLRVSMEAIVRDLRMAGFLAPAGTNAIQALADNGGLGGSDTLTLNTGSEDGVSARITLAGTLDVSVPNGNTLNLGVANLGGYGAQDVAAGTLVTLVGPENATQVVNQQFTVTAVNNAANCGAVAPPCLTLQNNSGATATGTLNNGYLIVKSGAVYPSTVAYSMITGGNCPAGQNCIARSVNGGAQQILANNITNIQFQYVMDDGTEIPAPAAAVLDQVRAVRVTLSGQTTDTTAFVGENPRLRNIISMARLRNR